MSGLAVQSATADALRHCRTITRRRARNFYYGLKLSPEPKRSALYAVYAWMRQADDLVDEHGTTAQKRDRLNEFKRRTAAVLRGEEIDDEPLWIALRDTVDRFEIDPAHLNAMLHGQLDDLRGADYESFEDLREYCCRVASSVGLICIRIWGYCDPDAPQLAIDRGIAFQLTNILRDFCEDYDAGRLYLPREDFRAHGLDPGALRTWRDPARGEALLRQQIERAESFYRRAGDLDRLIDAESRPSLWVMTRIYHDLLVKMGGDPSRIILGRRLRLSTWRKGAIALQAKLFGASAGVRAS